MIRSAEEFAQLRLSENPEEYGRAATDSASIEVWRDTAAKYPHLRFWIAQNKTVPSEMLVELAQDPDVNVRSMVARKRKLPVDLQFLLATDDDPSVRAALARNLTLVAEVRMLLLADHDPFVAEAAGRQQDGG